MPTFYDPIELENIDINDNAASFYLINLQNNAGFKFCATTQNLGSSILAGGDPVTRIKEYWPITRDQLNQANLAVLFPNDDLRAAPLSLQELNEVFHFNPPFNPATPKMTFGQPQAQLPVVMTEDVDLQQKKEKIIREATALGMNPEQIAAITFDHRVVEMIYSEEIPLNDLITLNTVDRFVVRSLCHRRFDWIWRLLPTASYAFRDIVLLINGARDAGMPYDRILALMDIGWKMDAIRLGVWDLNLLSSVDDELFFIIADGVGLARDMLERFYSLQEYIDLYHHLKEELHMTLEEMQEFLWSESPQNLFQAIHNGSTSFDRLSHLSLEELNHAIAHDDYPEVHRPAF